MHRRDGPSRARHSRRRRRPARASARDSRSRPCGPVARRCCRRSRQAAGKRRRTVSISARSCAMPSAPRSSVTPPGTTRSIINLWPKQALRGTQGPLAQDATFRIHQGEGRIVADRAEIAEMVGDTLELRHQRPEPDRARRRHRSAAPPRPPAQKRARRRRCCRPRCGPQASRPCRCSPPPSTTRCPCGHSRAALPAARRLRHWR